MLLASKGVEARDTAHRTALTTQNLAPSVSNVRDN